MNKQLTELIEWMEEEGSDFLIVDTILMKAKQLQQEEPRMYTQEEMDKAKKESYILGRIESINPF